MTNAPEAATPRTQQHSRWMLAPIGLLVSSVVGLGSMAFVAIHDPNFALEHDYYQKAIHWDQTQAQAADNQRLAYRFSVPPSIELDSTGRGVVELRITDHAGQPVSGAHVVAEAFPNAFSDEITQLTFSEGTGGVYSARLGGHRPGLWEIRLSMDSGNDHATAIVRCDLKPGGAA